MICRNALPAKIGNGETWPDGSDCSGIVRGRPAQAPKNRAAPPHNHRRWHMSNADMDQKFNHAANDSPRSGSTKRVTPVVWCAIVVAMVVIAVWFEMHP